MDDSLRQLEGRLESLIPQTLSENGRFYCHSLIDELHAKQLGGTKNSPIGVSWLVGSVAACLALCLGLGGGWFLGKDNGRGSALNLSQMGAVFAADFDQIDHETWRIGSDSPGVYVSKNGEVRELAQETEVTREIVKHRDSGTIVTVETRDHHLIDSPKSEF